MNPSCQKLAAIAVLCASGLSAMNAVPSAPLPHDPIRNLVGPNNVVTPLLWAQGTAVTFVYDQAIANPTVSLPPNVVAGSNPRAACVAGANEWNGIANISIVDGGNTALTLVAFDGVNLVTFSDPILNGINAIAGAFNWSDASGALIESDIAFGQQFTHDTTGSAANGFDVQSVAGHEFGHAIGLEHSPIIGSRMFPFSPALVQTGRFIARDDRAGLQSAYPTVPSFNANGVIQGRLTRVVNNAIVPVGGGHVYARDIATGEVVTGSITDGNGDFSIGGIAAGFYTLDVEPLDGPFTAGNLGGTMWGNVTFDLTFGQAGPIPVTVRTAQVVTRNLSVVTPSNSNLQVAGVLPAGAALVTNPLSNAPITVTRPPTGSASNFRLFVNGTGAAPTTLGAFPLSPGISIIGPPVTRLVPGGGGVTMLEFVLSISSVAAPGLHNLTFNTYTGPAGSTGGGGGQGGTLFFTGGLRVLDTTPPTPVALAYSVGCAGNGAAPLTLSPVGLPAVGGAYNMTVGSIAANEVVLIVNGVYSGVDNLPAGVSGCFSSLIQLSPLLPAPFDVSNPTSITNGIATFNGSIPAIPALAGITYNSQAFAVTPGAHVRTSNGLRSVIQ